MAKRSITTRVLWFTVPCYQKTDVHQILDWKDRGGGGAFVEIWVKSEGERETEKQEERNEGVQESLYKAKRIAVGEVPKKQDQLTMSIL